MGCEHVVSSGFRRGAQTDDSSFASLLKKTFPSEKRVLEGKPCEAIPPSMTPKTHQMTLQEAIAALIEHPANTNHTGLSLCPEVGWRLTFTPSDRSEGEVAILAKEQLHEWAGGHAWDELQYGVAADWIRDMLGGWLRDEPNYSVLMEAAV